ncbi:hypothetical protein PINS_up016209 [Pythium insidiosum]|nr:hypothetical protein PINS_up016209 [Pythium insidiosum]
MIKRDLERKSMGVLDLLKRMGTIVEDSSVQLHEILNSEVVPSDDVKRMARLMTAARLIEVKSTGHEHFVHVRHIQAQRGDENDIQAFAEAMLEFEGEGPDESASADPTCEADYGSDQESVVDGRGLSRAERARAKKL